MYSHRIIDYENVKTWDKNTQSIRNYMYISNINSGIKLQICYVT